MSVLPGSSADAGVWARNMGSAGPVPLGGGPTGLPIVTNPNLPSYSPIGGGNLPPPIPQSPLGAPNTMFPNPYATANNSPSINQMPFNLQVNPMPNIDNQAYQQRLAQLENENVQRKDTTGNLTQMGTQLLHGQMEVQEQVLQYQFMLEDCMDKLDNQNYVLNEQEEQLALLRSKIRHLEYLMDAYKFSKDGNILFHNNFDGGNINDHNFFCCGDPLSLPAPSTSPFYAGGPTRATPSTFQPFNPRYRSPNSRATVASNIDVHRSVTPTINKRNFPTANERPSRRLGNINY